MTNAFVDGQAVPLERLSWAELNFGQFHGDAALGNYELRIPRKAFVERLQPVYEQAAAEFKADDMHDPDAKPHLREIGYSALAVVLNHPRQFDELVRLSLYEDVFAAFLPPPSASARFVLNSVEDVRVTDSEVIIRGRGFHWFDRSRPAERMATIREFLERRRTISGVAMLIGFALFLGGGFAAAATQKPPFLALPGLAILMLSMFYGMYGVRCPKCRGKIGVLLHSTGTLFRIPENIRFCPFCGVELDSEAPEPKPKQKE